MNNYIDGFVFPIPKEHLTQYKEVAVQVSEIWKEYGAISYHEYVGDDFSLEGTKSFIDNVEAKENEVVIFGWVVFPSKEIRDAANLKVPQDARMAELVTPIMNPEKLIFDARRMIYGGFKSLI